MEALLERFLPQLRAFVRSRMSALLRAQESESDLVQSACRELFAKGDAFEYQGEQAFRAWLFTAVGQKLLAKERNLRREKRDPRRQVPLDGGAASGDGGLVRAWSEALSPSGVLMAEERVRALEAAFDALPEHYREVISLSRIARLDRARVAAAMGRSEDSVRNLLHRALAALAEALDREQPVAE